MQLPMAEMHDTMQCGYLIFITILQIGTSTAVTCCVVNMNMKIVH